MSMSTIHYKVCVISAVQDRCKQKWLSSANDSFILGGLEIRDRFSGAVEAFARRNGSGLGLHSGDYSRHRSSDDVPSSKDVVGTHVIIVFFVYGLVTCNLYYE